MDEMDMMIMAKEVGNSGEVILKCMLILFFYNLKYTYI